MPPRPTIEIDRSLARLKIIQREMRDAFARQMRDASASDRTAVASFGAGDYIYAIDRSVEHVLHDECRQWAREQPLRLIAEGLGESGEMVLPEGTSADDASFCLIVDPLDGTRGLMYDKRSAWILAGLAPNRGAATNLSDIVLAVQSEVPTTKQYLADVLWAVRGAGAHGERDNLLTGETHSLPFAPSRAVDLAHGFASLTKFFAGRKPIVAEIEEALIREVDGLQPPGRVRVFDDQYISSGGQLYELIVGHDRFNGDIRPALMKSRHLPGDPPGLAAHPYDVCTELIAREAGVIVTGLDGRPLTAPLNVEDNVAWLGYANAALRERIEPVMQRILRQYGLISSGDL